MREVLRSGESILAIDAKEINIEIPIEEREIGFEMSSAPVYIIVGNIGEDNLAEEYKDKIQKFAASLKLKAGDYTVESLSLKEETPEEWDKVAKDFRDRLFPGIKENPPQLIIPFGMVACYPFYRKVAVTDTWFNDVHNRLDEKSIVGTDKKVFLFTLPSLKLCVENEIVRDQMLRSILLIRGLISDQKIVP